MPREGLEPPVIGANVVRKGGARRRRG